MTDSSSSSATRLRITETFYSLQGEADTSGWPTVFVRLTGCPLRCTYCDTKYAYQGGEWFEPEQVIADISKYDTRYVCVTGGEPLAQAACVPFLKQLCDEGYDVSLETSGAIDISEVDPRVSRVVDIKTPASGEQARNLFENIDLLTAHDQIKFVVCDRNDYQWTKEVIIRYELAERCPVLISPSAGQVQPRELADWILEDRLPVRFQLQLHKLLWNDEPGR